MAAGGGAGRLVPHFCIFQADEMGLAGWEWTHDCWKHRWDALLEGMQKCLALDGKWSAHVKASLFAGGDAIHVTGEIQSLAMPILKKQQRVKPLRAPCSVQAWEEMLWENFLQDRQGLRWEHSGPSGSRREARQRLLGRLDELLAEAPASSVVLAFTPDTEEGGAAYDQLKVRGMDKKFKGVTHVYLLLGGAHGFDYQDDADGLFFEGVLRRFAKAFGSHRVARVSLGQDNDPTIKFPTASLAAFLSIEYARGMLDHVIAGLQTGKSSRGDPGTEEKWADISEGTWVRGAPEEAEEQGEEEEQEEEEEQQEEEEQEEEEEEEQWDDREEVGEEELFTCQQKMWSLCGTWWDTRGSMYEIAGDDTGEYLIVHIIRPHGRKKRGRELQKTIYLDFVDGEDGLQIVWEAGSFMVTSPLPEEEGSTAETVEWRAVGGRAEVGGTKSFTWHRKPRGERRR